MVRVFGPPEYVIKAFEGAEPMDPVNDNVDVEVCFPDGRRCGATFFALENIVTLMDRYRQSGECGCGLYFWCVNMVVIRRLTQEAIAEAIRDMIATGEFEGAFARLGTEELG